MLIGEAPGAEEERTGRPFVGPSGQLLNLAIESADMQRDELFVTNAYKLRPEDNRTPTDEELAKHEVLLAAEFDAVQPRYVLTLGGTALKHLTGMVGIRRKRGQWQQMGTPSRGYWLLPTYHPAYTIYNQSEREVFLEDVRTFFRGP